MDRLIARNRHSRRVRVAQALCVVVALYLACCTPPHSRERITSPWSY